MRFAIVKEYLSAFSAQHSDVIIDISETFSEAVELAIREFIADHPGQKENATELLGSTAASSKIKCKQYVLRIHDREQVIGYYGQDGYFSIVNAGADNVFSRLLKWIPIHTEAQESQSMKVSAAQYTGVPEDYFPIDPATVPAEWPVDEIDCAINRANGVIALIINLLSSKEGRPLDSTLADAIWSAIGNVDTISKLAQLYSSEALDNAARTASSGLTAVSMYWNGNASGQPADFILIDCLGLVVAQLAETRRLSYQKSEQQRQLRAG